MVVLCVGRGFVAFVYAGWGVRICMCKIPYGAGQMWPWEEKGTGWGGSLPTLPCSSTEVLRVRILDLNLNF